MRCPVLIGRDELAAELAGAVGRLCGRGAGQAGASQAGASQAGAGQALVLLGEAGIGKSRLAGHLAELAASSGLPVVSGRGVPGGVGGALGPVTEVLSVVARDRALPDDAQLAPYLAVLAPLLPAWRRPDWPGWSGQAEPVMVTAEAVLRVLRWASGGSGLVLCCWRPCGLVKAATRWRQCSLLPELPCTRYAG